jgi:hypothetical protein
MNTQNNTSTEAEVERLRELKKIESQRYSAAVSIQTAKVKLDEALKLGMACNWESTTLALSEAISLLRSARKITMMQTSEK